MTSYQSLRFSFAALAASLGALALAACQGEPSRPPTTEPEPEPPFVDTGAPLAPGNEQTVGADFDQAKVAFTARAGGFRGGHDTHRVDISNGLIEITAREQREGAAPRQSRTLALQTASVVRGDVLLDSTPLASALSAPDVVTTARGGYRETVRNAPEGIEQSWHFDAVPEGEGDLMIAISASGLDYQGVTASGLHFRQAGELGLRYGHGTWIEADGDRWEVPAQFDNGHIVLAVPAEIVAGSAYPAVLDPIVTAELLNDVPVLGSSGADNAEGDIAGDASGGYLAVWQDRRNTRNDDIWGTRISSTGAVLDTHGIKIFESPTTTETHPVVAWVGDGWVVAWHSNGDIAAAKVAANGTVTQLGIIAGTPAAETVPAIAGRGNEALLTWMVGGADVYAARYLGGSGANAFGAPFAVASSAAAEKNPDVAADPAGDYLVVFHEGASNDNIRAQRVTAAGALSGAVFDVSLENGSQTNPSVSFNGTDFVAVWTTSTGTIDIRGARISAAGAVLDASPGVHVSNAPEQQTFPDISCGAGSCFVSWQDRRNLATTGFDLYGKLVSGAMVPGAEVAVTTANRPQSTVGIAFSGAQWMAVWTDLRDGEVRGMFATRVSAAGAVLDATGIQLGKGNDRHAAPTVTRTPSIWSVMWAATRAADYNAVHVRYSNTGAQLDATPITVSGAAASQLPTGAVYTGTNLVAVWTDNRGATRDIYGARINPANGQPLDANGFAITTAAADQAGAKIASNGTTSLVVWQDRRTGNFDVHGALLAADGTITVADFVICSAAGDQARPTVAYDTTNNAYLVTWQDPSADTVNGTTDIRAARVSAAGALLDPACGSVISAAPGSQLSPDIAFASGRFLIVWEDRRNDPNGDIYGARVSLAGGAITVQDPSGLAISAVPNAAQQVPSVAPYGGNFVLAWEDSRNLATTKVDIYGSRVVAASGVAEAAFAISTNPEDERSPDIADGPSTTSPAKVAYLRTRPDLDSVRVQVRRITFQTSTGAACSTDSQCASGFCVDSRCCDTACGGTTIADCQACSVARGAATDGVCGVIAGPNVTICRNYARVPGICDLREYCDGVSAACPPDVGTNQGVVCNSMTGAVCPSNTVAGAPHICPGA